MPPAALSLFSEKNCAILMKSEMQEEKNYVSERKILSYQKKEMFQYSYNSICIRKWRNTSNYQED